MKAILTRYIGPTNTKVTIPYPHKPNGETLCAKRIGPLWIED